MADTYNPIFSREQIRGGQLFQQRPVPDAQTALVFSGEGQPLLTITHGQRGITRGEMLWGKYNLLYKVDMTEHPLSFRCDLPCATDAFDFHADVRFTCAVRDQEMIVRRNVTDVRQALDPLIVEVMRSMSRNYQVEESEFAEREIGNRVKNAVYDAGFQLNRFVLTLSLEQEARQRIREKRDIQDRAELEKTRIQSSIQREQEMQKLHLQRQQFEMDLIKLKMEFYSPLLKAGNWQMLALQLAQNPGDVQIILQQLNQQKQIEREHQMKMLKMLLDADALEGSQISEVGKRVLQGLFAMTEESTPALESGSTKNTESHNNSPEVNNIRNDTSVSASPDFNWDED